MTKALIKKLEQLRTTKPVILDKIIEKKNPRILKIGMVLCWYTYNN